MKWSVPVTIALALAGAHSAARADGSRMIVLKSEGGADAKTRAKIDATLVRLAQTAAIIAGSEQVTPGEISFGDAVVGVGCKPELPECLDEVLGMLGVDEMVAATITPKFGVLEVAVRRIAKGGVARDASATISADRPDDLQAIATLFKPLPVHPDTDLIKPEVDPNEPPAPKPAPPPVVAEPKPSPIERKPPPRTDDMPDPHPRRGLHIAGIATGGALALFGMIMWGQASGIQDEIDLAPEPRTRADFDHLADLERRGDSRATGGNVLFVTGVALGALSTYFYVRGRGATRRASATRTTLAPARFGHGGAGLTLTFGAAP